MWDLLYSGFVWLLFLLIFFVKVKKEKVNGKNDCLVRLNSMRGIFAVEIVIGHVIRYEYTLLYPLGKVMIISVAFFFFISGFGMVKSYREKDNYLKGFLGSKTLYMVFLALITFFINVLIDGICPKELGYYVPGSNILTLFFERTNWYLGEQLLFYVLFYFVYKYVKKYRVMVITVITLVFVSIVFVNGWIEGWYASGLAFPAGVAFGEYYEELFKFISSFKGKLLTVVLTILGMSSLLFSTESIVGMVYLRNVMCLAGILILLYFTAHFACGNKISRFLGAYSVEIYLFQFVYLQIAVAYGWDFKVRLPFVLFMTILTAFILHPIVRQAKKYITSSFRGKV